MKKIISIHVSFLRAGKLDCFEKDIPMHGKLFFSRNAETKDFCGIYTIPGSDSFATMEVINLLHLGILYYPTLIMNFNNPSCKLYLQEADEFDFIYSKKFIRSNQMYFVRNAKDVTGPFYYKSNSDIEKIKTGLQQKTLYVPCKKQSFEKVVTSKSA